MWPLEGRSRDDRGLDQTLNEQLCEQSGDVWPCGSALLCVHRVAAAAVLSNSRERESEREGEGERRKEKRP